MKKILAVAAMLLFSINNIYAQKLSANDMLVIAQCDDYDCVSERMNGHGYEIKLNNERNGAKTYDYSSRIVAKNKSNPEVSMRYKGTYSVIPADNIVRFVHVLPSEQQYERLLDEFKKTGFEYVEAGRVKSPESNTALTYKCQDYPELTLTAATFVKEHKGNEFKTYEFILSRPLDAMEE